jgi:endonuclease YncB( thermonuclease family)
MVSTPALNRFNKLIDDISALYIKTRNLQVRFGWEIGRRIVIEEQHGELHAAYGSRLLTKVSKDLTKKFGPGFSVNSLRKMRQFYLLNPIQPKSVELNWSQQIELLPIEDTQARKDLQKRAVKEDLTSTDLRQMVKKIRKVSTVKRPKKFAPLKFPTDLKLNTFAKSKLAYKLPDGCVLIDCGFVVNWPVKKSALKRVDVTDTPSYTYEATVDRVIDGDTLVVVIEVGFSIKVYDKLRLRGIDTPELKTVAGQKAKTFVQTLLPVGSTIVIKSHKSRVDLHGRFVVDVLFRQGVDDPKAIIKDPVYLNQYLLDEGYAVRMAE